jgi:FKBP-type peptidyl-prolyl cis-trans isomerase
MNQISLATQRLICGALLVLAAPFVGAQTPQAPAAAPAPAASNEQNSYLFGLTFGEQLHRLGVSDQLSMEALQRGLHDGLQGKKSAPADQQQLNAYVHTVIEGQTTHNQAAAKEFLEHNAKEKGVTTTASGLEYKIVAEGDRKAPAVLPTDEVTVQYRGKLLDGSEFDSTYSRGQPATFPVNGVIQGWQEALVMMKPGAKWQLFVPPDLAYGPSPKPGIPGGSLLIFEVELMSVKPRSAPPAPTSNTKPAPPTSK